jgi:hypothetical protein
MIRERILVYGQSGCGKTYAHLKIAQAYPKSKFLIIDTDDSIPRMLESEFTELENIQVYPVQDWSGCIKALGEIKSRVKADDWVVVDMLCSIWDFVQTFFIEEVFNQDTGSYFLQARKELKAGASSLSALKGWVDWAVINKLYQGWINEINYKLNCHVFFTCKATRISKEDDPGVQDIYSIFGVKPEGEKRNIYRVHSAFLLSHDRNGFDISTVKDRGRIRLENVRLTPEQNFATRYLQLVAGWAKQ